MNHYVDVKDQIDIKENEIKMLQQKLSGSSHGQLLKEIDNLTAAKGMGNHFGLSLLALLIL